MKMKSFLLAITLLLTVILTHDHQLRAEINSTEYNVNIWNLTSHELKFSLNGHTDRVYSLVKLDGNILASASLDKQIYIWNLTSGQLVFNLTGHSDFH